MQIKDRVNQTVDYVEQYYHLHKRDASKPKIWDLIIAIRYLEHELNAVKERNVKSLSCSCCRCSLGVVGEDQHMYCEDCAYIIGYCTICGKILDDSGYCENCNYVISYDPAYDCLKYTQR